MQKGNCQERNLFLNAEGLVAVQECDARGVEQNYKSWLHKKIQGNYFASLARSCDRPNFISS